MPFQQDGRECCICRALDSDEDLIVNEERMAWGYPRLQKDNIMVRQGRFCFYCLRVYLSQYSGEVKLNVLVAKLGSVASEHTKLFRLRDKCIELMTKAGTRHLQLVTGVHTF